MRVNAGDIPRVNAGEMMDAAQHARFELAILPHLDTAHNLARHVTGSDADAQDVVQEACLRAIRHFQRFIGTDGRGWFLTITRNVAYDLMRQGRGDRFIPLDDAPADAAALMVDDADDGMGDIDWADLERAMQRMPAEFREVIVLREVEGLSYAEIADVTGVPAGTVMSRLSRARRRLRQLLVTSIGEER